MTTANQVVREERENVRGHIKRAQQDLRYWQNKERALTQALEALSNSGRSAVRKRQRKPPEQRVAGKIRRQQILEFLAKSPDKAFSPADLARETGMPRSTAQTQLEKHLVPSKAVIEVRKTDTGKPVVRYSSTTVEAGRGVRS